MRRISIALTVASLAACGEPQHENPFDPKAPADRQARTSFSGTVSPEPVGGVVPGLAGIQVSVAGRSYAATTDANGRYLITGVPPGTYTIQAVLADYETTSITGVTATLDTGTTTVELPVLAMRRVRADLAGTVLLELPDDSLEATGGAGVSIAAQAGAAAGGPTLLADASGGATTLATSGTAFTDSEGAFVIPDVPAPIGSYTLTASKYGYVTQTGTVTFLGGAFVVLTVQLVIDPGAIVGSVAVSGAGDSFGVTVRARGSTQGGTPWEDVTTTDALGGFRISGLPAGTYTVSYERGDLVTASTAGRVVAPGLDTTLEPVTLSAATGSIQGVVQLFGASSSAGVVVSASGPTSASTVTDGAGAFTLSGLAVGTYAVAARKDPDWQPSTTSGVTVARDATTALPTASLSPYATASISGVVALEGGAAPAGTTVTLGGADFRGAAVNATAGAGVSGAFSFPALVAGSYQVVVSRDAYDTPAPVGVSLATGQAVALGSLTLAASRGGAAGTVTAGGAASQAGTVVIVSGGPDTASALTDAAGNWVVSGLRVGTGYTATYERPAYASAASAPFGVTSGAVTAVAPATLALATTGALSGTVAVERGSPSGVDVSLIGTDVNGASVTASTTTASGGAWSIACLRQGTYAAAFSKAGYDPASLAGLAVGAGAATAPGVTLEVSLGTVAGSVSLSPGAIVGFSVGTDFSGVVVTLDGADVPVPAAVSDASGAYRFEGVPVSLTGASYGVAASKTRFTSRAVSVLALANATAAAPAMTLPVAAGSLTGVATLTNVPGGGDGLASAGVGISITGTAFNGASFSDAALSAAGGAWTSAALPPGTYDVIATASGRTCPDYARAVVGSGAPTPAGTVLCLDAVAPSGLVLGAPTVTPPQQDGYTAATSVTVPIVTPATDATTPSNLRGYELARGASPDWTSATLVLVTPTPPASLTFDRLAADARNVLWARPVDTAGNAGAAVGFEVVQDSRDPAAPSLSTARAVVDSTSATVTISGSEGDANFYGYESATSAVAPTAVCPATSGGAFAATPSSAAVTLAADMKTCFYARAVDRAGRLSAQSVVEVTSDLIPPTSPTIAPLYDPSLLTVHAEYVDFFVSAPATDEPAGGGTAWKNVAWVEVDTGAGFQPLCPSPACRLAGVYAPCSCGCTDARLVCDGTTFEAIRVPLLDGTSNSVGVRAVDLAGNVGSGASQLVATATSLLPVETGPERDNNPRGRGRLLGHRYTDTFLRLRDLGDDGRPDPSDASCNVGALGAAGGLVSRIAVLGPRVVVHADGDLLLRVRRPGPDGLFCSPPSAVDDTETTFYTAPATVTVRNVTGSFNHARTGEYAAWVERSNSTFVDTVMVQAPSASGALTPPVPAPVALFTASNVTDVLEGGDCLLSSLSSGSFRVDCKAGGLGGAAGATTYALPATARAASLSSDGALLGWLESSGGAPALHVRSAGPDRLFGTADDTDVTRLASGTMPFAAAMAIEPGHLVVSETSVSGSTYWLIHWSAGPDGVFDAAAGADDTVSRVLPSSEPRFSPSILAGGLVAYSVSGLGGNLSDVLASDLSTYRWEAIEAAGFNGLGTNGAGTLFFHRGFDLTARLPDGTEQQGGFFASSFAAAGADLVTVEGSTVNLRRRSGSAWFGTPTAIYTGAPLGVAAGDRWALVQTTESGARRYRVSDLAAASPTTTLLPIIPGTTPGDNGFGISAGIVAYQCLTSSWNACVHHPGPNGIFGDGDDVTLVLKRPSTGTPYGAFGLAVHGDKIAFADENGNLTVAGTGPDGVFNTADDTEDTLGPAASSAAGTLAVAGDYVAWLQIPAADGVQVIVADLAKGTQRQVTAHYSMKERPAIDPSGRLTWIDYGFSAPTIFLYAP